MLLLLLLIFVYSPLVYHFFLLGNGMRGILHYSFLSFPNQLTGSRSRNELISLNDIEEGRFCTLPACGRDGPPVVGRSYPPSLRMHLPLPIPVPAASSTAAHPAPLLGWAGRAGRTAHHRQPPSPAVPAGKKSLACSTGQGSPRRCSLMLNVTSHLARCAEVCDGL